MMNLPPHKCALFINHNEHRVYYETIEHFLDCYMVPATAPSFASDEARARAIATDELWTMQWYPDTPIGFHFIAAPTLEELLAFALNCGSAADR